MIRGVTGGTALVVLLAAAITLAVVRDRAYGDLAGTPGGLLYVRSPAAVKRIALSYDAVLADVYWIRAIQYYGGTKRSTDADKRYTLLYPLLDITTTLDPRFAIAYRFGAIFLAEPPPGGPGRPDQAIALLQKGLRATPDRWQYLQDIGFVYYWYLHDYRRAGAYFERASLVPGAPWFLKSLEAVTLALKGGDRARSRLLWQQLRETGDNDWLRANAEMRLAQLDALDRIDGLDAVVRAFEARTLRRVESWEVLVRAGVLPGIPLDPAGVPYEFDPASGRITVSARSPLYPLPAEPAAAEPAGAPDA